MTATGFAGIIGLARPRAMGGPLQLLRFAMHRFLFTALFLLAGCGQTEFKVVPVSGVVKLDGQPLANGVVAFQPIGSKTQENPGPGSTAYTDATGKFSLATPDDGPGAVVGNHRVQIWTKMDSSSDDGGGWREKLPTKYNTNTTLNFEVPAAGTDQANFDLSSK